MSSDNSTGSVGIFGWGNKPLCGDWAGGPCSGVPNWAMRVAKGER